jgi:hypothetical protein
MARNIRKPLSFTTTLRNPSRIPVFLQCILPYEEQVLTNEVIYKIVRTAIARRLYSPLKAWKARPDLYEKFSDSSCEFQITELNQIMDLAPQNHKEAGFDCGWPSRFDTWYKFLKELGFLYYEIGKPIRVSEQVKILMKSVMDDDIYDDEFNEKFRLVFLNSLVRYCSDNPFRRNLNQNQPFPLLLRTISCLKEKLGAIYKGIYKKEVSFFLCWQNNDANELANFIISFRLEYGEKASDEIYFEKCLKLLETNNMKLRKMSQIQKESIDDYIRKMRLTGLIVLRGGGFYLDVNSYEKKRYEYIVKKYQDLPSEFKTQEDYYKYASTFDNKLYSTSSKIATSADTSEWLNKWAKIVDNHIIIRELEILGKKINSEHEVFKYIDQSARLEFLISVYIKQVFPNVAVYPQYSIDDEGLPTSTARGNVGDIKCVEKDKGVLVEVTMAGGRQQTMMEIWPIERHLQDFQNDFPDAMCHFIAPTVYKDSQRQIAFVRYESKLSIMPRTISEFINYAQEADVLYENPLTHNLRHCTQKTQKEEG